MSHAAFQRPFFWPFGLSPARVVAIVFGSVLHGTDLDGSDLELLVDALPGATLFDLGGLQLELEELLGIRVDLLTPADLPPKFRAKVLAEARPV